MRRQWGRPVRSARLAVVAAAVAVAALQLTTAQATTGPRVLRVGTWHGIAGQFSTIQSAVDAARPGDWILVAPGDYHESPGNGTGVLITTPDIHLRGMDRNTTLVDGTKPGAPACSP